MRNSRSSCIVTLIVQTQRYHNNEHNVNYGSAVSDCGAQTKGENLVPYAALEMV